MQNGEKGRSRRIVVQEKARYWNCGTARAHRAIWPHKDTVQKSTGERSPEKEHQSNDDESLKRFHSLN